MPDDKSAWKEIMQYSFLSAFANDATLDSAELAMLERLALRDQVIDEQERAVLSRIFARVTPESVSPDVLLEIERFKAENDIP